MLNTPLRALSRNGLEPLHEDQERSRLIAMVEREQAHLEGVIESMPGIVWEAWGMPDANDLRVDYFNDYVESVLGYSLEEEIDRPCFWLEIIYLEDRQRAVADQNSIYLSGRPGTHRFRWVAKDGSTRWMESHITPVSSLHGDPVGMRGITLDVTDRAVAELALQDHVRLLRKSEGNLERMYTQTRNLAGRLITAQEEERRRISRELHDNLSQKLALMGLVIQEAKLNAGGDPDLDRNLQLLGKHVTELSDGIRQLSRELHPSVLEHSGLEAATRSFCTEFGQFHALDVTVEITSLGELRPDIALCIYRITQEALHNVAKHAEAGSARVALRGLSEAVVLRISDNGIGFDPDNLESKGGLGLVGMRERVRLVNGCIKVKTRPGLGTVLSVRVPRGEEQIPCNEP